MNAKKEGKAKYYKNPKYGQVYGDLLRTPEGLAVWPSLVTPKAPPKMGGTETQGAPRFELSLLFEKGEKTIEAWIKDLEVMVKEMLVLFNEGKKSGKLAVDEVLGDGDSFDLVKYPYYKGKHILTARNTERVTLIGPGKEVLEPSELQGGMYAIAAVTPFICSHGVKYKLSLVQKTGRDSGERIGGTKVDPTSLFDVVGEPATSLPSGAGEGSVALNAL